MKENGKTCLSENGGCKSVGKKSFSLILAKIVRVITVAPIMSLVLFTVLLFTGGVFENTGEYVTAILLLTVLPLTAYPLQKVLPPFKGMGRDGQRTLAMIMANVGYILSIIYALAFNVSAGLLTLFLTYLVSGAVLLVINKAFGIKASGHACGLIGPVTALAYFTGWISVAVGAVLFALVFWGSLKTGRHTVPQLICGAVVPVVVFTLLVNVIPI